MNDLKLIVDLMPRLFVFHIFGRKNEGKVSRNLFLAFEFLKLWDLFGILNGVKKFWKESGNLLLMHLCMNSEEEYWKVSLNFRRRNFEKIGSVWELWALPATFRTHFFVVWLLYRVLKDLYHPMQGYQIPCGIERGCCK